MIYNFLNISPKIDKASFIAESSDISGDVEIGEKSSIWCCVTIRGDIAPIRIGKRTNIQDGTVCHVATDVPLIVGNNVSVGHNAIIHACTIEDFCLIGMGAIVMDNAIIGHHSIVGAGSLVTKGKVFPPRSLIQGSPARLIRELKDEEIDSICATTERYIIHSEETRISRKN